MKQRYDYRVLGRNFRVTNDTFVTGLNNNDIIIGGSGSGKTGGILYPSIKCAENESFVLIDTKGLLSKRFSAELESKGYDVKIISFTNPDIGLGYNPLEYIRIKSDGSIRYQDIVYVSYLIMPTLDSTEPIWEECGRIIIQFLIAFCLEKIDKSDWNMKTILSLYHSLIKPEGISFFFDCLSDDMESFAAKKLLEISANKAADKMYASVLGFVSVALAPFEYSEIQKILNNTECIDIHAIGKKKQAIFVHVSDVDRTYDTIINLCRRY